MRSQRLVALGLAVLGLLLLTVYATSSISIRRATIAWSPSDAGSPSTPLDLSAERPEYLRISVPCDRAAEAKGRIFSTGRPAAIGQGLELHAQPGSAWASLNGRVLPGSMTPLTGGAGCTLSMTYERSADSVQIESSTGTSGPVKVTAPVDPASPRSEIPWQVNALTAAPQVIPGITVDVVTQPTGFGSPAWRWCLAGLAIVAAVASLLLLARSMPRNDEAAIETTQRVPKWVRSDSVVSGVALLALFVVPPTFDDGWVLTTLRQYDELGYFSNYFSVEASPQPLGFWWSWLQHWWLSPLWTPGFLLRLPAAIMMIAGWWLLRRRILSLSPAGHRAALLTYLVVAGSFLFTLRPEPLISVLVIAAIATVVSFERTGNPRLFVVLAGLSALGLSAHQTGWCVMGAALAASPGMLSWARSEGTKRAVVCAATLALGSLVLVVTLAMLGMNLSTWRRAISTFADDPTSYSMTFREDLRLEHLMNSYATGAGRIFVVALIIVLVLAFLSRSDRGTARDRAGYAALGALAGLLLTSSKLPDHLGVIAGPLAVLAWIVAAEGSRMPAVRAGMVTLGLGMGAWVATNPLLTGPRNTDLVTDHANLSDEIPFSFLPVSSLAFWLILLGIVAVIGWRLGSPASAVAAALLIAVPLLGLLPGIGQAGNSASWVGQSIGALKGDTCGLGDHADVPVKWAALQPARPSSDTVVLLDNPAAPSATPRFGPVPDTRVYAIPFGSAGFAATPWFPVTEGTPLTAWTQSGGLPVSYSIDYVTSGGQPLASQAVRRTAELGVWQSVQVTPPPGAAQIRISWFSSQGPLAVSSPVAIEASKSLREVADGGPVWVSPNTYLEAPCLTAPSIATGTYAAFDWSFGPQTWNGSISSEDITEMGCPTSSADRHLRCAYAVRSEAFRASAGATTSLKTTTG